MSTYDNLAKAYKEFLRNNPFPLAIKKEAPVNELLIRISEHLLFDESDCDDKEELPLEFIPLSEFVEETQIASIEWLTKVFRKHKDAACFRKFENQWWVDPEKLVDWFIDNEGEFPIMGPRCKRYNKKLKK